MKIIFVRHGDPDYSKDCLTELGKFEADRVADRLAKLPIKKIYSSPLGRAYETALTIGKKIGMDVEIKDFLRETPCTYLTNSGKKFDLRDRLISDWCDDPSIYGPNSWRDNPDIKDSSFPSWMDEIYKGLDELIASHGYKRNGKAYDVVDPNHDIIVIVAHFGSISDMLSHIMDISPELLWHHFICSPTSVTILTTEERRPGKAIFRCSQYGDVSHLEDADINPNLSGRFCECYTDFDKRHD